MAIDRRRVRAICFDVDGTLSDSDDQFVLRLARILGLGRFVLLNRDPLPMARWLVMRMEGPGNFALGLSDRMRIDAHLERLGERIHNIGLRRAEEPFLLVDGVGEMLASLHPYYPMAVVSARGKRTTEAFLNRFSLLPYFQAVASAQTCRYTKPYPDPILWVAERMGVNPQDCLMIGDTVVDIRAGKAAGAQTAGVLCGFGEEAELKRSGADLIIDRTPDILDFLLSAN